ncbi:hypothetical protein FYJ34_03200 [Clostridiaceae bacterium 68-1-5]|uniref:Uncharacterized protein n=1 Tax=Suipraeoptans intestinalis TaxID=2606628 RepID=A0A6N7US04_9FIRM|nr:hypothetical protein [Suipraeoptans intestinalis]MSR93298.1 hypothetical protein [Suipraeoptans intestinalis]
MNFKDIISIAAVITTTVVAVVSIFLNHRSNLKHQLFLEKLRIYKELMVIVSQSTSQRADREELRLRLIAVKQEIILFSTEPITRKLADIGDINFTNNGQTEVQAKEKFDRYLSLLNLMRRDLLKQSDKISDTTLKRLI